MAAAPTDREPPARPHLLWTGLVVLGATGLALLAWWLWSRPTAAPEDAQPTADVSAPAEGTSDTDEDTVASVPRTVPDALEDALAAGDFEAARAALAAREADEGWSDALAEIDARIERREDAHRRAIRTVVVELAGLRGTADGPSEVFARASLHGQTVWATPALDLDAEAGAGTSFVLRTTLQDGLTLELFEDGGLFDGPERVGEPFLLAPLATRGTTTFTLAGTQLPLESGQALCTPDPFGHGLTVDRPARTVPPEAELADVLGALDRALVNADVASARALLARVRKRAPDHADLAFLGNEVDGLEEALNSNHAHARLEVWLCILDPRTGGGLWADGGSLPSLRVDVVSGDDTLVEGASADLDPYLDPKERTTPPAPNVLQFDARGDAPLGLRFVDTRPRFGSRDVGTLDLGLSLTDLPTGSGMLSVTREPRVLVLPKDDDNRVRRVVVRWRVER